VGETILSVAMSAPGYHTTSGATVVVQPSGFQGKFNEYTFQTPRVVTYDFLKTVLPGTLNTSACHVVGRLTPKHTSSIVHLLVTTPPHLWTQYDSKAFNGLIRDSLLVGMAIRVCR
jgi:hypothetical protein